MKPHLKPCSTRKRLFRYRSHNSETRLWTLVGYKYIFKYPASLNFITISAMSLIEVSPEVSLQYLDSGNSSDFVLVTVHGHSWGAGKTFLRFIRIFAYITGTASFGRCIEQAHLHGLRVVALNRRGFSNSTPLSPNDIQLLRSKQLENHTRFLRDRAWELANFLVLLNRKGIQGQFILVGWSLGNAFCLKLLEMLEDGSFGELGIQLRKLLATYIIYGIIVSNFNLFDLTGDRLKMLLIGHFRSSHLHQILRYIPIK